MADNQHQQAAGPADQGNAPPPVDPQIAAQEQHLQAMIVQAVAAQTDALRVELAAKDQAIATMYERLTKTEQTLANLPSSKPQLRVQKPELFYCDRAQFRSWLSQLHLYFQNVGDAITNPRHRVLTACSFIKNPAYEYVAPIVDSASSTDPTKTALPELDNYELFHKKLHVLFGPHDPKGEAQRKLQSLKQKKDQSVEQYAAEFQRWQLLTEWNDESLIHQFRSGLQEQAKILMIPVEPQPKDIHSYMSKAAEMDSRWRMAKNFSVPDSIVKATPAATIPNTDPDAMDLSRMSIQQLQKKVPKDEWTRRLRSNACLNCGRRGHRNFNCRSSFSTSPPPQVQSQTSNRVATATAEPADSTPATAPVAAVAPPTSPPAASLPPESINRLITLMEGVLKSQQQGGA